MKKAKIITISLLGLLMLIPFITPTKAQVPSYVGVAVEERYDFALNVYDNWDIWFEDNMTAWLASIYGGLGLYDIGLIHTDTIAWAGVVPAAAITPQLTFQTVIDDILPEDSTLGFFSTEVDIAQHIYVDFYPSSSADQVPFSTRIGNSTAAFANMTYYGASASSAYWLTGDAFIAPVGINWTEFVAISDIGLDIVYGAYGVNTKISEITNGYSLLVDAMDYGNNTLPIRMNSTYGTNGVLTYNSFEYGGLKLYDYVLIASDPDAVDPVITASSSDFSVEHDYTGETISWTATDANPHTYTVERNGTAVGIATAWTSGVEVQISVPDGLAAGDHGFEITFMDDDGNSVTDTVVMTVGAGPAPPPIPGYDLPIVLGIFSFATIGLIVIMKKKK